MQNADFISRSVTLKALIPAKIYTFRDALVLVLEEGVRFDLGADGNGKILLKRLTVDIRTEVFDVRHGSGFGAEIMPAIQNDILAALIRRGHAWLARRKSAVEQGVKVDGEELRVAPPIAELGIWCEAAFRVILRAEGKVGAAAKDPVDLLSEDQSLDCGGTKDRDQESRLTALGVDRMGHIGHEKERHAQQRKPGVSRSRLAVRHVDLRGKQLPVRLRQHAGGHGALQHPISFRSVFEYLTAGEHERVVRGVHLSAGGRHRTHADGAGYFEEMPRLLIEVHCPMGRVD